MLKPEESLLLNDLKRSQQRCLVSAQDNDFSSFCLLNFIARLPCEMAEVFYWNARVDICISEGAYPAPVLRFVYPKNGLAEDEDIFALARLARLIMGIEKIMLIDGDVQTGRKLLIWFESRQQRWCAQQGGCFPCV